MYKEVLIELNYLGPLAYFSIIANAQKVHIEAHDSFIKSSYRNRCEILSANGRQLLSIPIKGGRNHNQLYKNVKIDNTQNWQNVHWQAIKSAYGRAPFFEHYSIYFEKFYKKNWENLFDLNLALFKLCTKLLKIDTNYNLTNSFSKELEDNNVITDFRSKLSPKISKDLSAEIYESKPYLQVFSDRFPFEERLSIIDLIFNEGPNAKSIL